MKAKTKIEGLRVIYFVLKPSGKTRHARASRMALRSYADSIEDENDVLASELRKWAAKEDRCQSLPVSKRTYRIRRKPNEKSSKPTEIDSR